MRRIFDFLKGLIALAAILLLLVGVPLALVVFVGEPFSDLRRVATGELLSDNSRVTLILRSGLAIIAWLAWAQVAMSMVVEIVAVARGRVANRAPVVPGIQMLARKLVVTATLLINASSASPAAVSALMPLALPPPVESVELEVLAPIDGAANAGTTASVSDGPRYTAVAGDTFWSLAEDMLGDGLRWSEVREANLGRTMSDGTTVSMTTEVVRPGWELVLPSDAVVPLNANPAGADAVDASAVDVGAFDVAPDVPEPAVALDMWEVEKGDHFWGIAEKTLAESYGRQPTEDEIRPYWLALMDANRDRMVTGDADLIMPGQEFEIPSPSAPVEQQLGVTGEGLGPLTDGDRLDDAAENGGLGDRSGAGAVDGSTSKGTADLTQSDDPRWTVADQPVSSSTLPAIEDNDNGLLNVDPSTLALGILGTAVGGGGLLSTLRRRRQLKAARRLPGDPVDVVSGSASAFEARIRPVADTEAVRWLDVTNRLLSKRLAEQQSDVLPAVLAMRAGEFGVEVLLDEVCAPPAGFVDGGGGGAAWRIDPDLELDAVEEECRHAQPYSPALVPVGRTDAGDLLVDFEQLAVVSVGGDVQTVAGWMATIATAIGAMSWSQPSTLVSIGVKAVVGATAAVVVPTNVEAWADEAIAEATAVADRIGSSTYKQRVDGGEIHHPTIVLLGPGNDALAHRLRAAAELAHSPLVLITTTEILGHARVELTTDAGVLTPDESGLRLEFTPVVTESATAQFVAYLMAQAAEPAGDSSELYADVAETIKRRPLDSGPIGDEAAVDAQWPPPPPAGHQTDAQAEHVDMEVEVASATTPDPAPAEPPVLSEVGVPTQVAAAASSDVQADPDATLVAPGALADVDGGYADVGPTGPPAGSAPRRPPDVEAEKAAILAPRPVEVRLLTGQPSTSGVGEPTSRLEAIVIYLAAARRATADEVGWLFWPRSLNRTAAENALGHIRETFGVDAEGNPRLTIDEPTMSCVVSDEVGSDWHRADQLIALAERTDDRQDEMACLTAALDLIESRPGAYASIEDYGWMSNGDALYGHIEARLVDAAHRLGDLALADGRPELAAKAAEQGLLMVPGQEALHRLAMKASALLDDAAGIERSYRAVVRSAEDLSGLDEVQAETSDLYAKLTQA